MSKKNNKSNNNDNVGQEEVRKIEKDLEPEVNAAGIELYSKVLETSQEASELLEELSTQNTSLNENVENFSKRFKSIIDDMQKNNIILYQVPKKIDAKIDQMIPAIAVELDKVCQEKVKEYSEIVKDTAKELNDLKNDMQVTHKGQMRKRFYGFLINILCAGAVAAAASYTVLTYHPNKVFLRNAKSVVVEGSEVSFWGSGEVLLQDGKKSKKK